MSNNDFEMKIAAVIITFNPDDDSLDNIKQIKDQFDQVIIVSNSDSQKIQEYCSISNPNNTILISNSKNVGLGKALNQGVKRAFSLGFTLCATFDQDTEIHLNFRDEMLKTYNYFFDRVNIGIISPNYSDGIFIKKAYESKNNFFLINSSVQSGSIFIKKCFDSIGYFREDFFIECIDTEFCLRARSNGFKIISSNTNIMNHGAGEKIIKNLFGRQVVITNHSSDRLYLQYRNFMQTFREYCFKDAAWSFSSVLNMAKKYLLIIIFEKNRIDKSIKILKGSFKGFFHKGRFNG